MLASEAALSTAVAADALAAACALDALASLPALHLLLTSRSALLVQQLEAATTAEVAEGSSAGGRMGGVEQELVRLAHGIQTTFSQVGELFLPPHQQQQQQRNGGANSAAAGGSGSSCLLQATVQEGESDASELLFSGRGTVSTGAAATAGGVTAPEAEAWRLSSRRVHDGLVSLTSGQVEQALATWLRSRKAHSPPTTATATATRNVVAMA